MSASPENETAWIDLTDYRAPDYQGRGPVVRLLWYFVSLVVFQTGLFPFGRIKPSILRLFGAQVGKGLVVKPYVRIKFPWRLTTGDHVWIGEETWIDNLADVTLGSHICISQGCYFCTGSHNHRSRGFELETKPIVVGSGAWIAARTTLLPGAKVGANAIVAAASVVSGDVEPATIAGGNPAKFIKHREAPTES